MSKGDLNQAVLMGLDWKSNSLHQLDTNYSKMMAQFQLATDPFTNEIDGDFHPCLLASKASQADNPTYDEVLNVPHKDGFLQAMRKECMSLEIEDSVAGFLAVRIERNQSDRFIKLTQLGLIKRIIDPTGLTPLTKDSEGDPPDGSFNYTSIIGMLCYLQSNSRPDIA
jgi:hypothetical protein